jgi:hypothetical protein
MIETERNQQTVAGINDVTGGMLWSWQCDRTSEHYDALSCGKAEEAGVGILPFERCSQGITYNGGTRQDQKDKRSKLQKKCGSLGFFIRNDPARSESATKNGSRRMLEILLITAYAIDDLLGPFATRNGHAQGRRCPSKNGLPQEST